MALWRRLSRVVTGRRSMVIRKDRGGPESEGTVVLHKEVPAEPAAFLDAIAPFRDGPVSAGRY
jgi:hypothetical protein